jgi:prepilin-type N-terminal cleavage/methylation domain-containing protein
MIHNNKGFTLVELLISMSLLSLVLLLGNWSFSLFISKWEGRLGYFSEHVSQTKDYILLNDIVSSILPYVTKHEKKIGYYFNASAKKVEAVSQSGVFHTNSPVVFKLSVEQVENGENYLLYQEVPVIDALINGQVSYTHEKILIAKANNLSFSTFGWESVIDKINAEDPLVNSQGVTPRWHENYNAAQVDLMPIKLQVQWDEASLNVDLLNDHGRLLRAIVNQE